jgi:hypothetical protein
VRALWPVALALLLGPAGGFGAEGVPFDPGRLVEERELAIGRLLEELGDSELPERQAQIARVLGKLRAAEAAAPLVQALLRLHRDEPSPLREPSSRGHALAQAYVEALRDIGRPGLEPFLEALARWDRLALDLTFAYVSVHGAEGILMLRHRALSEADDERRAHLEAAAWFTRLRAPELPPLLPPDDPGAAQ